MIKSLIIEKLNNKLLLAELQAYLIIRDSFRKLRSELKKAETEQDCHLDALKVLQQWNDRYEKEVWEWADYLEVENQS